MAKSLRQKEKLLRILQILEKKSDEDHYVSMADLISELAQYEIEAERKSIYDDIKVLQDMGYDIVMSRSKNGGYALLSRRLEKSEILPLADAVSSSRFITEKKSRELIKKMESFLSDYEAGELDRNIYVSDRIKTDNESIYIVVDSISNAIRYNKKITFQYCEWNIEKELVPRHNGRIYLVSPCFLTWSEEKYYLVAFDEESDEIRHYRCDKIKNVNITKDGIPEKYRINRTEIVKYENKTFGMYGGDEESVTLVFPESKCGIMIDRFGKEPTLRKEADGLYSIRVKVIISDQFFGWIAGLGSDIYIKAPEDTVFKYKDFLKKNLERYE